MKIRAASLCVVFAAACGSPPETTTVNDELSSRFPDLRASNIALTPFNSQLERSAVATVCNRSRVPAPPSDLMFVVSTDRRIRFDPTSPSPSDPVAGLVYVDALEPRECRDVQMPHFVAPVPNGTYWLGAVADPFNNIRESSERNSRRGARIGVGFNPDFRVTSAEMLPFDPQTLLRSARVVVCNEGNNVAPQTELSLHASANSRLDNSTTDPHIGQAIVPDLQVGACSTLTVETIAPPLPDGEYRLATHIDPNGAVAELLETNNKTVFGYFGIGNQPDFVVRDVMAGAFGVGGERELSAEVCNYGNQPAPSTDLVFLLSTDSSLDPNPAATAPDPVFGQVQVPPLEISRCLRVQATGFSPPVADGEYFFGVVVDSFGATDELLERNNASLGDKVGVGFGPDLVIEDLKALPFDAVTLLRSATFDLCNRGNQPAYSAQYALRITADDQISDDPVLDPEVGFGQDFEMLNAGACRAQTVELFPAPLPDGEYYLAAVVDPYEVEPEILESNNRTLGAAIGVGQGPDLLFTEIEALGFDFDQNVRPVRVRVCNYGNQPAYNADVHLVLSEDLNIDSSYASVPGTDVAIGFDYVAELQVSSCLDVIVDTYQAPLPDGEYHLAAVVDSYNVQPELLESNNTFIGPDFGVGLGPDLQIRRIIPGNFDAFQTNRNVTVTVCNDGVDWSFPTDVVLLLSVDDNVEFSHLNLPTDDAQVGFGFLDSLAPNQCAELDTEMFAPPVPDGEYTLGATVDPFNNVAETLESNNTFAGPIVGVGVGPDLVADAPRVQPFTTPADQDVIVNVCNRGNDSVFGFDITLVASNDDRIEPNTPTVFGIDVEIGFGFAQQPLNAGACQEITIAVFGAPLPPGEVYLAAVVDQYNNVAEIVESNNISEPVVYGVGSNPDLTVTAVEPQFYNSQTGARPVDVTVCNHGNVYSSTTDVAVVFSADTEINVNNATPGGDTAVGFAIVNGLDLGTCATVSVDAFASGQPDGAYYVGAVVDPFESTPELIESNNVGLGRRVGVGNNPDLQIRSVQALPFDLTTGARPVQVELCNDGTTTSPPTDVGLFLSTDRTLDMYALFGFPDVQVGFINTPWLPEGSCVILTGDAFLAGPAGPYFLIAATDPYDGITELIEDNNEFVGPVVGVGHGPDLVVTQVGVSGSVATGLTFEATVCNEGNDIAWSTEVAFVATDDEQIDVGPAGDFVINFAYELNSLAPGACHVLQAPGFLPPFDAGAFLGATADPGELLPELLESNNSALGPQFASIN